jgi:hypothetical protein
MTELERRFTPGLVEVRASDSERRTIGGYAIITTTTCFSAPPGPARCASASTTSV